MSTSPVQQDVFGVLAPFVVSVTTETAVSLSQQTVLQGLPNRSSMPPASPGFAVMTVVGMKRLRTNIDSWVQTGEPSAISHEMGAELRVQIDFYGATSQDWAAAFMTLFRDDSGVQALAPTCAPLYADDARMAPLDDSEEQYEQRWTVDAFLQYNPITTDPMQFADSLTVTVVNVDEAYPP
jgi:hypothetical protein